MVKISGEYKGYAIEWNDYSKFSVSKEGIEVKNKLPTISDCETWIDKQLKAVYKRVPILVEYIGYGGRKPSQPFIPAEATSIVDGNDVWITNGENRSKTSIERIYVDTPSNRSKVEAIIALETQIVGLNAEIKAIKGGLEHLTVEMMIPDKKMEAESND